MEFFDGVGRRVLGRDSMLAFLSDREVVCIGLVVRREKDELCSYEGQLTIGVRFQANHLTKILAMLEDPRGGSSNSAPHHGRWKRAVGKPIATSVFQASSSYFAYEPVLRCLQGMVDFPFQDVIVNGQQPADLTDVSSGLQSHRCITAEARRKLEADASQLNAVETALRKQVTLVQGPPGTGKTFVGVQIAQAILANPDERILCLCYTNHALDDFLLSIHEDGLPLESMVRIGRSPKINEKLKERCLSEQSELSFDRNQTRLFASLKETQRVTKDRIEELKGVVVRRNWGPKWWTTVEKFLSRGDAAQFAAYKQLQVPSYDEPSMRQDTFNGRPLKKGQQQNSGWKSTIAPDFLWQKWCAGTSRSDWVHIVPLAERKESDEGVVDIWDLDKRKRKELMIQWQDAWIEPQLEEISRQMQIYQSAQDQLDVLRSETKVQAAQRARVVGCTTTSAAMNWSLLNQVRPTVIIIEEAAEILECNVLTSLFPSARQVIMIGDHKQLRPKLESYQLRKESGKGIDFDVSLFERLALQSGFPIHTLKVSIQIHPFPSAKNHCFVLTVRSLPGST